MTPRSLLFSKGVSSSSIALACLFLASAVPEARADDPYFRAGVQAYQKADYKKAYGYFSAAGKNNPYDADNIYYQAMTLQRLNNNKEAIKLYASLVSNFSYSNAGKLAASALNRLDPEYYNQLTKRTQSPTSGRSAGVTSVTGRARATSGGASSEGQSADFASLPSEARIPYTRDSGGLLMIDASINNRSMKMFFDTGAESCVFGKNHLRESGLAEPKGAATGLSVGVGSSGSVETWGMPATLKVGNIERKNMEIQVQANMVTRPLLGQSFFRDYQYTIDKTSEESGTIHFVKKAAAGTAPRSASSGGGRDLYAVPFQRAGRNLIVTVEVDGHSMTMFFDTGASNVAFSADQLKKANIPIPEDAQTSTTSGIGGETTSQQFPIKRIKMGPIEKTNFTISCVGSANMQYPLLGQSFFGDWQYTIDNAASVIRFVRR